jgi:hypothetical protein
MIRNVYGRTTYMRINDIKEPRNRIEAFEQWMNAMETEFRQLPFAERKKIDVMIAADEGPLPPEPDELGVISEGDIETPERPF